MGDPYRNVIGGALKMKRQSLSTVDGRTGKKKKKRSKKDKHLHAPELPPEEQEALMQKIMEQEEKEWEAEKEKDTRTDAEKRYEEKRKQQESKQLEKLAAQSYRERVEAFNKHISNLSEHHDIPKVGPGPR